MNYLAHLILSGDCENIKIGNFIADGIKGKKYKLFPQKIQIGILLHRQIDWFTDNHDLVKQSKRRLSKKYGHYKGVIIDIFYDHFLAKNWNFYSDIPLEAFSKQFYLSLENNFETLPERIQYMYPFMKKQDWLTSYSKKEGIEKVLIGMNKRTKGVSKMNLAIHDLNEHYYFFEEDFLIFFKKLRNFSAKKLIELKEEFDSIS
jgi:acyl carrier protein phosphodiesterase